MRVLVTGAAGFIGMHTSLRLLARGDEVVGVDNLNDYYDVRLKEHRLARLSSRDGFEFLKLDIENRDRLAALFKEHRFDGVVNLAARAGVRKIRERGNDFVKIHSALPRGAYFAAVEEAKRVGLPGAWKALTVTVH